jgi:hypothetical protein
MYHLRGQKNCQNEFFLSLSAACRRTINNQCQSGKYLTSLYSFLYPVLDASIMILGQDNSVVYNREEDLYHIERLIQVGCKTLQYKVIEMLLFEQYDFSLNVSVKCGVI